LACLAVLAEINGQLLGLAALQKAGPDGQYALLLAGLSGLALGLGGWQGQGQAAYGRQELLFMATLTGLALFLRVWDLNTPRVLVDEFPFMTESLRFQQPNPPPLLRPMNEVFAFPWLYTYGVAGGVEIFGPSYASTRLLSALLGALSLPALYLLARSLYDRPTAGLAAILLLTFPPHWHFSRLNLLHGGDALAGLAALALLARAARSGARMDYVLAGIALGLSQYFYEGGRLAFPAIALAWVLLEMLWGGRRWSWRGLTLSLLAALLTAAPIYYTLWGLQTSSSGRLESAGLGEWYFRQLLAARPGDELTAWHGERVLNPFFHYISVPDMSIFYAGTTPLLLIFLLPFFLAAFPALAFRPWRGGGMLLVLWLLNPAVGASLLVENGASVRFVLVFPALVLAAAVGLRALGEALGLRWRYVAALAIALSAAQAYYYVNIHLPQFDQDFRLAKLYPDGEDAILRVWEGDYPPGTHIVLISDPVYPDHYGFSILYFLRPDTYPFEVRHPNDITPEYIAGLHPSFDYLFFIPPQETAALLRLQAALPLEGPYPSPYAESIPDQKEFLLYFLPGGRLDE
jgi:4-amino-4-deoxy-L-arabinose transferase-like glycosyltransferase